MAVLILANALSSSACDPKDEEAEPTAPWRADAAEQTAEQRSARRMRLRAPRGQHLSFFAQGKEGKPEGRIPLRGGSIEIDPLALEFVTGELTFDLGRISVAADPTADAPEGAEGPAEGSAEAAGFREEPLRTGEALRWLGLGSEVPAKNRRPEASFRIRLAKNLSEKAAYRGKKDGETARVVTAKVEGDLTIRDVEVHHIVSAELRFEFAEKPGHDSVPTAVVVRLENRGRVPLSEHDIRPRDDAGVVRAADVSMIGRQVGSIAQITGELRFEAE